MYSQVYTSSESFQNETADSLYSKIESEVIDLCEGLTAVNVLGSNLNDRLEIVLDYLNDRDKMKDALEALEALEAISSISIADISPRDFFKKRDKGGAYLASPYM